jgi:ribosomal protein S27E
MSEPAETKETKEAPAPSTWVWCRQCRARFACPEPAQVVRCVGCGRELRLGVEGRGEA